MASGPAASRTARLAPRHRKLLQLAFDAFQSHASWPQVAKLQHELARQGERLNVRDAISDLDPSFGRADTHNATGELVLTIKGIRRCKGSEQLLDDLVRVIGYFFTRYLDASAPPAEVTSADLQRDLDLSAVDARKVRILLSTSGALMFGGGGSDDNWRWQIDDQILRFHGATTIDQVLRVAYPPRSSRSSSNLRHVQSTEAGNPEAIIDWAASPPGWGSVEGRLAELGKRLVIASTKDDWQDVGRRCREIVIEAATVVFSPRLISPGYEVPGTDDAKARLDAYFKSRAPDLADDLRAFVAGTLRLANALTHSPRMRRLEAVSATQAVILIVRVLQEIQNAPRQRRPRSAEAALDRSSEARPYRLETRRSRKSSPPDP